MVLQWHLCALLLVCLGVQSAYSNSVTNKVVCYFGSWAGYRNGNGKFDPENIDPTLCTHLIYSFVGIDTDGTVKILDEWNELPSGKNGFNRFLALKSLNPEVKALVAIGGWNEGSEKYSAVVNSDSLRAVFVQSIVDFVLQYEFDGFDLDWEYPAQRGGAASDKEAYVKLLQELRTPFDEHGLLLTAAVGVGRYLVGTAYDVPALSQYLDFINMMTYDLHTSYDGVTGQNAPLYASSVDVTDDEKALNVNASIRYWIQNGAAPEKLVLGMGTYGRTFTLTTAGVVGPGAPCSGPGNGGPYTYESGMLGYNEISELQAAGGWTVVWDDEQKVPYAVKDNQWVGYDNVESIKLKTQFAIDLGLGGTMIWSVETDDFLGLYHDNKFPLLRAINEVLGTGSSGNNDGSTSSATTTTVKSTSSSATTTTTAATSTSSSGSGSTDLCTKEGYVRDPNDCQVFYYCQLINGAYVSHKFTCQAGLVYDPAVSGCNYQDQVEC